MPADPLHEHIASLAARSSAEARRLAERALDRCWPGGASDRTEPAARAWLARWHPTRLGASVPVCRCAEGRCGVCN